MTPFQENTEVDASHWEDESLKNAQEGTKGRETHQGMSVEPCEEKKVDSRPAVKVGQWWKWKTTSNTKFEVVTKNYNDKGDAEVAYPCGDRRIFPVSQILRCAALILDPDDPIEVGDRFEWEKCVAVARSRRTNGAGILMFRLYDEKTNKPIWPEDHSAIELRNMRRLPRLDHVADASKKVEADTPAPAVVFAADWTMGTMAKTLHEDCLDDGQTLVLGNPEPVKHWQAEAKIAADIYEVLGYSPERGKPTDGKAVLEILTNKDKRIAGLKNELVDVKGERDAALARVKELHGPDIMPSMWYITNLLASDGFDAKGHEAECVKNLIEDKDKAIQRAIDAEKRVEELEKEDELAFYLQQKQERKIAHLEKTVRKHEATIGHLNNRIMKMTNKEVAG